MMALSLLCPYSVRGSSPWDPAAHTQGRDFLYRLTHRCVFPGDSESSQVVKISHHCDSASPCHPQKASYGPARLKPRCSANTTLPPRLPQLCQQLGHLHCPFPSQKREKVGKARPFVRVSWVCVTASPPLAGYPKYLTLTGDFPLSEPLISAGLDCCKQTPSFLDTLSAIFCLFVQGWPSITSSWAYRCAPLCLLSKCLHYSHRPRSLRGW